MVINYGERGGLQNGKIAGKTFLAHPPLKTGGNFSPPTPPPLFKGGNILRPSVWLKLQAVVLEVPQTFLCPLFRMAQTFSAPPPIFCPGKTSLAPPPLPFCSPLPVITVIRDHSLSHLRTVAV